MTEENLGVGVPETPTTDSSAEELDPLATLDPTLIDAIRQRYVPKDEVEKQVGKVKSAEQRRAEQERQERLRLQEAYNQLEQKHNQVVDWNQGWKNLYERQVNEHLQKADPTDQAKFYQAEAERRANENSQIVAYLQHQALRTQNTERAQKMWELACQEVSEQYDVDISPNDPGALKIREEFENSPKLPIRLSKYATEKRETVQADVNRVPTTPPSGRRPGLVDRIRNAKGEDFENLYNQALRGELK